MQIRLEDTTYGTSSVLANAIAKVNMQEVTLASLTKLVKDETGAPLRESMMIAKALARAYREGYTHGHWRGKHVVNNKT